MAPRTWPHVDPAPFAKVLSAKLEIYQKCKGFVPRKFPAIRNILMPIINPQYKFFNGLYGVYIYMYIRLNTQHAWLVASTTSVPAISTVWFCQILWLCPFMWSLPSTSLPSSIWGFWLVKGRGFYRLAVTGPHYQHRKWHHQPRWWHRNYITGQPEVCAGEARADQVSPTIPG